MTQMTKNTRPLTGAFGLVRLLVADLAKVFEHLFTLIGWDTGAVVLHLDAYVVFGHVRPDHHSIIVGTK